MFSKTTIRIVSGISGVLAACAVWAQNPGSGTLTIHDTVIEYSQGPNVGLNPTPFGDDAGELLNCSEFPCDFFDLTVDTPDNLADYFPTASIRYTVSWEDVSGQGAEDYDFYLFDGNDNYLQDSSTSGNPELLSELAFGGVIERQLRIVYFAVAGSTYTAKIELRLGEPADGANLDELFGTDGCEEGEECEEGEGFLPGLKSSDGSAAPAMGAGSFGLLGAIIALAGLARRRV